LQDDLNINDNDLLPVNANGSFTFVDPVASGSSYNVTVLAQPAGRNCSITNGSGTASANVTNVTVACVGEWAWMGGSSTVPPYSGQSGVYGALGTASSTNIPGGRFGITSWTDASGNVWLFGGQGADSTGAQGYLNDLWKYTPGANGSAGEWTWMGGNSTVGANGGQPGVYGTLGTPDPANMPGGRAQALSWTDASGNFWLFGGYGEDSAGAGYGGQLNDLWKYTPGANSTPGEWTWMGGTNVTPASTTGGAAGSSGVYGTLGTAAPANIPGGREQMVSWTDASGDLWIFGGEGIDAYGVTGELNDLWKFDPKLGSYGEWTWMGGSNSVGSPFLFLGPSGVYGTLGAASPNNIPGGRYGADSWIDAQGNFWFFGGSGIDSTGAMGSLNDLWKYTPGANATPGEWTWMGGSSTIPSPNSGQPGVYGTQGLPASANIPGGRDAAVSWADASGNVWLFGGYGFDSAGAQGYLSDVWKYTPGANGETGQWTWMGGSSVVGRTGGQPGVYGALGTLAPANIPGGRFSSVSWIDASGNFWLFGGQGNDSTGNTGYLNDLWKYQP
jgi:N-acetylneuraminic acid mutarotase